MEVVKTNPRTQSFGPLSSGDMQYKNYYHPKTPVDHKETNQNALKLKLSASKDLEGDPQKMKANLPSKKTNDLRKEFSRSKQRSKSTSFDEEDTSVISEPTVSVGKLCSMFDNVTMRNINNDGDRRAHLKRYSAVEPMQRAKYQDKVGSDEMNLKPFLDATESTETDSVNDASSKGLLNIDAMLSNDLIKTEIDSGSLSEKMSTLPQSKTKGSRQRKGSEFDDFEDRIVPTGTKTIDISSLIAPSSAEADVNHCNNDNSTETQSKQSVLADFDLQKKRELDRLMQAQQEVEIHKASNVKRRSLKDKLSEMCSMNQESFDHALVPHESASQPKEQSAINIHGYVSQNQYSSHADVQESYRTNSVNDLNCKHGSNVNDPIVTYQSENVSSKDKSNVNIFSNVTLPIKCSEKIEKSICKVDEDQKETQVVTDSSIADISIDVRSISVGLGNLETALNENNQNVEVSKETNIVLRDADRSDSSNDSEETLHDDKPYASVVERFDAFLTSQAHEIVELNAGIVLPPVLITPAEVDVKSATVILDSRGLETPVAGLPSDESNEPSIIDDGTSNATFDACINTEDIFADISTCSSQKLSDQCDDITITGEVTALNYDGQGVESNSFLSNHDLTTDHVNAPVLTLPCEEHVIDLVHPDEDAEVSFEVEVSKGNELPHKLSLVNVSELLGVVDHDNKKGCYNDVDVDGSSGVYTNAVCCSEPVPKIFNEKGGTCEFLSPLILDRVVSTIVTPIQNAIEESTVQSSSDCRSTHQAHPTFDSLITCSNTANEKQIPSDVNEDIYSESNIKVSSNHNNDNQYQIAVTSIPENILPKKSNLIKSPGSVTKKVNFKDPLLNDVIETYGGTEYDRANANIDPIASSAEWELEKRVEKMDVFSVDLQKDERGLGLSIIGLGVGTETGVEKLGIFVKTLTENGASQKDGRIQVNDQILEVNGISLVGVTQYFAAQTLKHTDGVVRFLMGREKSRRTHYSPGAPLAGNPEMHKHIEEMNRLSQKLDEFEERALDAERTLEDVKVELLAAEERAHAVEKDLKDTKEQLAAATESPFIGTKKKPKHEIKKLQQRISDLCSQVEEIENSRKLLHLEIAGKSGEISTAIMENEKLKEQLRKASEKHVKEKEDLTAATAPHLEEEQNKMGELRNENARLKDEVHALTEKLGRDEELLKKAREPEEEGHGSISESKVKECKTELENSKANVSALKEKNKYLQSLVVELEKREEFTQKNIDIEQKRFREKEKEYIKQIDFYCERIAELENQLQFPKRIVHDNLSPILPVCDYLSIKEINEHAEPPDISRSTKPCVTSNQMHANIVNNVNNSIDEDTNLLSNDSGLGSINNIDKIESVPLASGYSSFAGLIEIGNTTTLKEDINVGSTAEIITDTTPISLTNNNSSNIIFGLDDLPEGKIDSESDDDKGQFQLIHEEDIEEEMETRGPTNRGISYLHSDLSDNSRPFNTALNGSLITDSSFEKWLGRLDSTAREEEAERIAAQVAAGTPNIRKYSNTSSLSSEEEENVFPKGESSYFEKSNQSEITSDMSSGEIDKAVNNNDVKNNYPEYDVTDNLKKCSSLDVAIPPTPILENKGALDKKALMKKQRAKPSRSPHNVPADQVNVCRTDSSETMTTSTLSHVYKPVTQVKAAQSIPDLSLMQDVDKPSKLKNKYGFNLPKAFKRTKLGKRFSHDKAETPSPSSEPDLIPVHLSRTSSDTDMHSYSQPLNMEEAIVPMAEKTESLNQEKANDAATEEAVVPFADVELMMKRSCSDTNLHVHSSEMSSLCTSTPTPPSIPVEPMSLVSVSSNAIYCSGVNGGQDELTRSESPEFYNERGIDVEMGDVNLEEDSSYKTQEVTHWDVKQVVQWLTEIDMSEYASSFRIYNVNGSLLLKADGRELKEYGVHNHEHRSQMKKYIKEFRLKYNKGGWQKVKDHKSTKDNLQFWKGKYKVN